MVHEAQDKTRGSELETGGMHRFNTSFHYSVSILQEDEQISNLLTMKREIEASHSLKCFILLKWLRILLSGG